MGVGASHPLWRQREGPRQSAWASVQTATRLYCSQFKLNTKRKQGPQENSPETRRQEWPWWPGRRGLLSHLDRCFLQGGALTGRQGGQLQDRSCQTHWEPRASALTPLACDRVGGPTSVSNSTARPAPTVSSPGEGQPCLTHAANPSSCGKGTPVREAPVAGAGGLGRSDPTPPSWIRMGPAGRRALAPPGR